MEETGQPALLDVPRSAHSFSSCLAGCGSSRASSKCSEFFTEHAAIEQYPKFSSVSALTKAYSSETSCPHQRRPCGWGVRVVMCILAAIVIFIVGFNVVASLFCGSAAGNNSTAAVARVSPTANISAMVLSTQRKNYQSKRVMENLHIPHSRAQFPSFRSGQL